MKTGGDLCDTIPQADLSKLLCTHTEIHKCTHTLIYIRRYMHIHTHTYTHTHSHTHTHTQSHTNTHSHTHRHTGRHTDCQTVCFSLPLSSSFHLFPCYRPHHPYPPLTLSSILLSPIGTNGMQNTSVQCCPPPPSPWTPSPHSRGREKTKCVEIRSWTLDEPSLKITVSKYC